jgi:3-deoxy-manno-octulosonate cytidylyltransferase (CMP-KDO synthetase)
MASTVSSSGGAFLAVVPARFGATRFPWKPLALLNGKPLVWHVYQQCMKANLLAHTVVATDDARIADECARLGIPSVMTGQNLTGTDRVAECAQQPGFRDYDGYVNVQGDEPFVSPSAIDAVAMALRDHVDNAVAAVNAYSDLHDSAAVANHNVVKVTLRIIGCALTFSRQPIPYPHNSAIPAYFRQLGLYGFTSAGLRTFATTAPGPVESTEGIEMLRLLEHGHAVQMVKVNDKGIAVDTPQDLERARSLLGATRPDLAAR